MAQGAIPALSPVAKAAMGRRGDVTSKPQAALKSRYKATALLEFLQLRDSIGGDVLSLANADYSAGTIDFGSTGYGVYNNNHAPSAPQVTIVTRVKVQSDVQNKRFLVTSEHGSRYYGVFCGVNTENKPNIQYGDGDFASSTARRTVLSDTAISSGEWHTIVYQFTDSTNGRIFIDGVEVTTTNSGTGGTYATGTSAEEARIGYHNGAAAPYFEMEGLLLLDEVLGEADCIKLSRDFYNLYQPVNQSQLYLSSITPSQVNQFFSPAGSPVTKALRGWPSSPHSFPTTDKRISRKSIVGQHIKPESVIFHPNTVEGSIQTNDIYGGFEMTRIVKSNRNQIAVDQRGNRCFRRPQTSTSTYDRWEATNVGTVSPLAGATKATYIFVGGAVHRSSSNSNPVYNETVTGSEQAIVIVSNVTVNRINFKITQSSYGNVRSRYVEIPQDETIHNAVCVWHGGTDMRTFLDGEITGIDAGTDSVSSCLSSANTDLKFLNESTYMMGAIVETVIVLPNVALSDAEALEVSRDLYSNLYEPANQAPITLSEDQSSTAFDPAYLPAASLAAKALRGM